MRNALMTASLSLLILATGCSTPTPQSEQANPDRISVTYEIYGMDCPGCHGGLEKNLVKIPGVLAASANWKQQCVTLSLDEAASVSMEQIRQAVEDSNFSIGKKVL